MEKTIKDYFKNFLNKEESKTSGLFTFNLPKSIYKTFLRQTEKIKKILTPKLR